MYNFSNFIFAQPWFLLLLPVVGVLLFLRFKKKYYAEVSFSSTAGFEGSQSWRTRLHPILLVFQALAMIALIFALARPQSVLTKENVNAEGIDIVMAMDVSSSMLAKDFEKDRLDASKRVAQDFVDRREHDRIGLVLFAGESFTQCPLTSDHSILKQFLSNLQCGLIAEGTAIGMGLANAVRRLKDSESKSKVVILLTDGVNNTGYIQPLQAASAAEKYGVKVYSIGVGTRGRARTPIAVKPNGQFVFGFAEVEIDEALLQKISEQTGGQYFRATDMESLEAIYDKIDKMERTKIEKTTFRRNREEFHWFVWIAVFAVFAYLMLANTVFRTIVQ
jgi:Ca-activated chloride channel family protein